jgi:hypothetical protein
MPSRSPLLLLPFLLMACSSPSKTCNLNLVETALTVDVTDAANGSCIEGAAVTATNSQGRVVTLGAPGFGYPTPPCGHYLGIGDNDVKAEGAWTVTVMKAGYATGNVPITMDHDGCHVVAQTVPVKLMTAP